MCVDLKHLVLERHLLFHVIPSRNPLALLGHLPALDQPLYPVWWSCLADPEGWVAHSETYHWRGGKKKSQMKAMCAVAEVPNIYYI